MSKSFSTEIGSLISRYASEFDVMGEVHPDDFIFHFLITNKSFASVTDAVRYYFADGHRSANILNSLFLDVLNYDSLESVQFLEFASGYGCVTRHLVKSFPLLDITVSDIHPDANSFIKDQLGLKFIQSVSKPEAYPSTDVFNAILALSFFSHMPKHTWTRWLRALMGRLTVGGYLLFTTHGLGSAHYFGTPPLSDGFWYSNTSEQGDLDTSDYGQTIVSPRWVMQQIETIEEAALKLCRTAFWWGHQDLYIVRRIS